MLATQHPASSLESDGWHFCTDRRQAGATGTQKLWNLSCRWIALSLQARTICEEVPKEVVKETPVKAGWSVETR